MAKRTCTVEECAKPHRARGLCQMHYKRAGFSPRTKYPATCQACAREYLSDRPTGKFCSDDCKGRSYAGTRRISRLPADHPVRVLVREAGVRRSMTASKSRRGTLRVAFEAGDGGAVLAELRSRSTIDFNGCWIWSRKNKDGYPALRIAGKERLAHRVALEASLGKTLGKQAAHHVCANTMCINPEHLQPVTARENTAEMLARTYMESRIADLEAALASLDPAHHLLREVGVVRAA